MNLFKGALGVCFALKSWTEYLLLYTYLITFKGKDVTFQQTVIKQVQTKNKQVSKLSICKSNTELKCGLADH